jgi:hypothetical protein
MADDLKEKLLSLLAKHGPEGAMQLIRESELEIHQKDEALNFIELRLPKNAISNFGELKIDTILIFS